MHGSFVICEHPHLNSSGYINPQELLHVTVFEMECYRDMFELQKKNTNMINTENKFTQDSQAIFI